MSRVHVTTLVAGAVAGLLTATASSATIEVSAGQSIQAAVNVAADGDEIVVAPGTYFQVVNLLGKDITLRSSDGPDVTIIDGTNLLTSVIRCNSGESLNTVVEGFTITGGDNTGQSSPNDRGAAIYLNLSSLTIRNCRMVANTANTAGAIYANGGQTIIEGCEFLANVSNNHGGAIYFNSHASTMTACLVEGNEAALGGGAGRFFNGSLTLVDSAILGNEAAGQGGGLLFSSNATSTLRNSVIRGNSAGTQGGGIAFNGSGHTATNCVIHDNEADANGGGVYVGASGDSATLLSCTIVGNESSAAGSGVYRASTSTCNARNCIIWGNLGEDFTSGSGGSTAVSHCLTTSLFPGAGNIEGDPVFMSLQDGDFRLDPSSPCVDAGSSPAVPLDAATDADGMPRVVNVLEGGATGTPAFGYFTDIGAFEVQPEPPTPVDPCPGDLNGDMVIDGADLGLLLGGWGGCL